MSDAIREPSDVEKQVADDDAMALKLQAELDAELAARLSEEENLESKDAAMAQRLQEEADLEDEFERSTIAVATEEALKISKYDK